MATQNDPNRPSPSAFLAAQRRRLEALQFAKRLVGTQADWANVPVITVDTLLKVADYIVTGEK